CEGTAVVHEPGRVQIRAGLATNVDRQGRLPEPAAGNRAGVREGLPMTDGFWRIAVSTGLLVVVLVGLALVPVPAYSRTERSPLGKLLRTLHKDELNRE